MTSAKEGVILAQWAKTEKNLRLHLVFGSSSMLPMHCLAVKMLQVFYFIYCL